jgi:hypothetical protein
MRANRTEYLFSVSAHTPPTMTVDSGEEFTVEVRGAFDDVEDCESASDWDPIADPYKPLTEGQKMTSWWGPNRRRSGPQVPENSANKLKGYCRFGRGPASVPIYTRTGH